ncbi:phosphopantetheine-binding protein [Streptomyces wedmorensis]|uniref:phosphopantetheine-binding protein n=1 Tax=Streptomyces wedmorensis TaxID=43759 RepID=UPI00341DDD5C
MTELIGDPDTGPVLEGDAVDVVAAVWAEALGTDSVDPDAGFFDLGASSATVLRVVRTLRRRWPDLKIVDVFSRPTVAELATFLDGV